MFRVSHPDDIPTGVPRDVRDVLRFSWSMDRYAAALEDWGDRILRVARFRRERTPGSATADVALVPTRGVELTASALRRVIAGSDIFTQLNGVHLGTAVVTEGLLMPGGIDQFPNLPDAEMRQWASEAVATGDALEYRGTVGTCSGWRYVISEVCGGGPAQLACYAPDEQWDEPVSLITDVVALDEYLGGLLA